MEKIYCTDWADDMWLRGFIDDNNYYDDLRAQYSYKEHRGCCAGDNDYMAFRFLEYDHHWDKVDYTKSTGYIWPDPDYKEGYYVFHYDPHSNMSEAIGYIYEWSNRNTNFHGYGAAVWRAKEGGWQDVAYTPNYPSTLGTYLVLAERIYSGNKKIYLGDYAWELGMNRSRYTNTRFFWDIQNGRWAQKAGDMTWREQINE